MPLLLLALILVPLAEIALFITIGKYIGVTATLACVLLTAIAGAVLMRQEGLRTLRAAQQAVERGEPPVRHLFEGVCIFVAGAFLLTPGFLTDVAGLLLLLPPVRSFLGNWAWDMVQRRGHFHVATSTGTGGDGDGDGKDSGVIDADFRDVNEPDKDGGTVPPPSASRWGRRS